MKKKGFLSITGLCLLSVTTVAFADTPDAPGLQVDANNPPSLSSITMDVSLPTQLQPGEEYALEVIPAGGTWPATPLGQSATTGTNVVSVTTDSNGNSLSSGTTYDIRAFAGAPNGEEQMEWSSPSVTLPVTTESSVAAPNLQVTPQNDGSVNLTFSNIDPAITQNNGGCGVSYMPVGGNGSGSGSNGIQQIACTIDSNTHTATYNLADLSPVTQYQITGFVSENGVWSNPSSQQIFTTLGNYAVSGILVFAPGGQDASYVFGNSNEAVPLEVLLIDANGNIIPSTDTKDYSQIEITSNSAALPSSPLEPGLFVTQTASPYMTYYYPSSINGQVVRQAQSRPESKFVPAAETANAYPMFYLYSNLANYTSFTTIGATLSGNSAITSNTITVNSLAPIVLNHTAMSTVFPVGTGTNKGNNITLEWMNDNLFVNFGFTYQPQTGGTLTINDTLAPISDSAYSVTITDQNNNTINIPSSDLFLATPNTLGIRWNDLSSHISIPQSGNINLTVHDIYGNTDSESLSYNTNFPQSERFCGTGKGAQDCVDVFIGETEDTSHPLAYSYYVDVQPRSPFISYTSFPENHAGPWVGEEDYYDVSQFGGEIDVQFQDGYQLSITNLNPSEVCGTDGLDDHTQITNDPTLPDVMGNYTGSGTHYIACSDWSALQNN